MRRAGFTLLEMMAVVMLTSIVFAVALSHYVNLSRASERATHQTADIRRATAILDRLARDFESTLLVAKADDVDPLEHPWIFYGESLHSEEGADHLKFMTRSRKAHGDVGHQSDFEVVAYTLRQAEDGKTYELMRWSSPQLPETLDRSTPGDESDGAQLLADGLAAFGVTFIDDFGDRRSSWDSSLIEDSGTLPVAVEIAVALAHPDDAPETQPEVFRRQVVLPVRPLDMEELLDPTSLVSGGTGDTEAEDEGEGFVGEPDDDPRVEEDCRRTPCAGFRACEIINCNANLGRWGRSTDLMLQETIREAPTFCVWKFSQQASMYWIIPNPECR